MKSKAVFGALLVSVALCSQGFGLELLDRMLGLRGCGCNPCAPACCEEAQACEPACCEQVACEPACGEPACVEPACCEAACADACCRKRCDLFKGLKGLADRHRCRKACRDACCKPACCETEACCPEPACCGVAEACCPEPACCEEACEPTCGKVRRCKREFRPVRDLLDGLFGCKKCCCKPVCAEPACCEEACAPACCEEACAPACCAAPACGGGAPVVAPAEEAAPLPQAPQADPSASLLRHRGLVVN